MAPLARDVVDESLMSDLIFFRPFPPITLEVVAARGGVTLPPSSDRSRSFSAIASLDLATPSDVSVLRECDEIEALETTRAGACFVAPRHRGRVPAGTIALETEDFARAFERVAAVLYPHGARPASVLGKTGIDATAIVHRDARLEPGVTLDPGVVIGPRAEIGSGTIIGAGSTIGAGVRIGRDCAIDCQVSIAYAFIGDGVVIHSGVRIGHGGPWLAPDRDANRLHVGRVIIQNGVEIGANAAIERGGMGDTVIGDGSRIEALASIGPDVTVERMSIVTRR